MGTSEFSEMHFDLEDLIQPVRSLEKLVIPFTTEEVDGIVKNLPSGKSPALLVLTLILSRNVGLL
jgi:hypothetical protein